MILIFTANFSYVKEQLKNSFSNIAIFSKKKSLFQAVVNNDIEQVEKLLKNGFDPNIIEDKYETSLIEAINNNYLEIVLLLLEYNVDVNQCNSINQSPLEVAIFSDNQHKLVPLLLFAGAKINENEWNEAAKLQIANGMLNKDDFDKIDNYVKEVIEYYSDILRNINL
ncbi:MAG: ankyrin repeat domain-containing protein [Silvanigrellaceae bacterium]|nr:ankyrin repeat domain-containing protein [Silvanigrellaceae bacterium]